MSDTNREDNEFRVDHKPEGFNWKEELKEAQDHSTSQEDPEFISSLPDGVQRYVLREELMNKFTNKYGIKEVQFDELLRGAILMDLIGISSDGWYVHTVNQPPALPDNREVVCDWCDRSSDEWEYKFWHQVHTASLPKVMCLRCTAWSAKNYAHLEHNIWTNRPNKPNSSEWNNWRPPEVIESPPMNEE